MFNPRLLQLSALFAALAFTFSFAGVTEAHEAHGKPALLQRGDCDTLGGAAFTLVGVGAEEDAGGLPIEPPTAIGPDSASAVTTSTSTVAVTVDEIVTGGHAIVVYASDEEMNTPISCGAVGGIQIGDDLVVGLDPVGDDGQSGIALLRAVGPEATVTIILTEGSGHRHDEASEATPTS